LTKSFIEEGKFKSFSSGKAISFFSLFIALGIALSFLENSFLPRLPIPGAKIGLAHLSTFLLLFYFTEGLVFIAVILRIFIFSLITGTFLLPSFFLSLGGGVLSTLIMLLFYHYFFPKVTFVGISLWGAFFHNLGQIVVAAFLTSSLSVFLYFPVVSLVGIVTGFINGYIANRLFEKLFLNSVEI
jgi:heptaprenyl diphosphate synthase